MFDFFKKRRLDKALKGAMADGVITAEELDGLDRLRSELGLSSDVLDARRTELVKATIQPIMATIEQTLRFSPEDEQRLTEACRALQVAPRFDDENLQFARALWSLENVPGYLPEPIPTDVNLTRGETVYGGASCSWRQMKKVRQHHGYVGATVGFRVAKGVRLSFGNYRPITTTTEQLAEVSAGRLLITNKRMMFVGDRKSTNFSYDKVATIELFSDGIGVTKTTGVPAYFVGMSRALIEYNGLLIQRFMQ